MDRWLHLLTIAYHCDRLRPIVAALLVTAGFALAILSIGPVVF